VVPKLRTFLDSVLGYDAKFVAFAEHESAKLQRFHSPNHETEMLALLVKLLTPKCALPGGPTAPSGPARSSTTTTSTATRCPVHRRTGCPWYSAIAAVTELNEAEYRPLIERRLTEAPDRGSSEAGGRQEGALRQRLLCDSAAHSAQCIESIVHGHDLARVFLIAERANVVRIDPKSNAAKKDIAATKLRK